VKENSKFCTKCGKPVPKSTPKEATCPNITDNGACGNTIRSDEKFCSECGWPIIDKAFESGTYMCSAKGESCKNLISPEESFCQECGSSTKKYTPKGI
jgi:rRNA maturation endonuclease Nob1